MLIFVKTLYWASLLLILYTYIGYGLLMAILSKFRNLKRPEVKGENPLPGITVLIPAFNEAPVLGPKLRNTLELSYPANLFEVLVITDGSTDGSDEIVRAFPQVKLIHQHNRLGKAAAINKAMELISNPVVVLTDANTLLNPKSLKLLVQHYNDPFVGAVSGEKRVMVDEFSGVGEHGEGLYWEYESYLKKNDALVGSLVGAAGELLSFRRHLFQPLESNTILDDFVISLRICEQGFRVAYEPEAWALERGSADIRAEQGRKVRIAAGGFQAMARMPYLFNFSKHPMLSFQYVSHRVLRWTFAPVCLLLFLLANIILVISTAGGWYNFTLLLQAVFYSAASIGWLGARNNTKWPVVFFPYYFVFMHWAVFLGWIRFLKGKQSGLWDKAERLSINVKD